MAFLDKTGLERLWLHILSKTNQTLASAKQYADDIKNDLLNGAGSAYDTLKELGDLIDENADAIDAIQRLADTKSDKGHIHDDRYYTEAEVDDALKFVKEARGEIITVNDSAEQQLLGLKLYGKTTQTTTTGKNLLNAPQIVKLASPSYAVDTQCPLQANKTYTLSFTANAHVGCQFQVVYTNGESLMPAVLYARPDTKMTQTVTLTSDANKVMLYVNGTATITNLMIEEGSAATDYESYSGGYASPSPNWVQPLVNAGAEGSIGVYAKGKNLLTNTATTKTINDVTFTANEDYSVTAKGTASQYAPYEVGTITLPAGTYILSGAETVGKIASESDYIRIVAVVNGSGICSSFGPESTFVLSEATTLTVRLDVTSGTAVNGTFWPMVRSVSADAVYEMPKDGGSLTASTPNGLPGIPVTSGGNYTDASGQQWICDEVDFGRGVYVQRVKSVTFNGAELWNLDIGKPMDSSTVFRAENWFRDRASAEPIWMSTTFRATRNTYGALYDGMFFVNGYGHVLVATSQYNTVDGWRAYLTANPMTVMCAIATPIEKPLSADEMYAYKAMTSLKPTTTVYNDSGAGMIIEYADVKIDEIEKALIDPTLSIKGTAAEAQTVGKELQHLQKETQFLDEANGDIITVNNSAELPLNNLKLYGKTTQATTTGKNLLNASEEFTFVERQMITLEHSLPPGTYTVSALITSTDTDYNTNWVGFIGGNEDGTIAYAELQRNVRNSKTITIYNTVYTVFFNASVTLTSSEGDTATVYQAQIEAGATATAYEPYTGGIPGPNPNYPLPLVSPGDSGSIKVKACGANLLRREDLMNGLQVSQPGDVAAIVDGYGWRKEVAVGTSGIEIGKTYKLPYLRPGVTYTLSFLAWCSGAGSCYVDCYPDTLPETRITLSTTPTRFTWTFNSEHADMANAQIRVHGANTGSDTWIVRVTDIQLEIGSTATPFESYKDGGSLTVSTPNGLPGIPVSSGGNYTDTDGQQWLCDEIDFERGVYVQNIYRKSFDGSETFSPYTNASGDNYFGYWGDAIAYAENDGIAHALMCTRLPVRAANPLWAETADGCAGATASAHFRLRISGCKTAEAIKENLAEWYAAGDPMTILCKIATPVETPLSVSELAAFRAMSSQKPTTTVYNDAAADMYVSYGTYKAGEMYEALGLDETTSLDYLPITGGVITGEGTVKLIPQRSNMEGGEIALGAPSGSPTLNSIVLDNYNGKFRVFGFPSADGTTKTGTGTPLVVDPYDKTIAGAGGTYTFSGIATSANKLNTNAGTATQPVYFINGVPTATTHVLEKSVPSDAVFTDTQVTQTATATSNYRPLIMGYNSSANTSTLQQTTCGVVTVNNNLYAQASTGSLYANKYVVNSAVTMEYDSTNECLNFVFK